MLSPSRQYDGIPLTVRKSSRAKLMVLFPAPLSPVNQIQQPLKPPRCPRTWPRLFLDTCPAWNVTLVAFTMSCDSTHGIVNAGMSTHAQNRGNSPKLATMVFVFSFESYLTISCWRKLGHDNNCKCCSIALELSTKLSCTICFFMIAIPLWSDAKEIRRLYTAWRISFRLISKAQGCWILSLHAPVNAYVPRYTSERHPRNTPANAIYIDLGPKFIYRLRRIASLLIHQTVQVVGEKCATDLYGIHSLHSIY